MSRHRGEAQLAQVAKMRDLVQTEAMLTGRFADRARACSFDVLAHDLRAQQTRLAGIAAVLDRLVDGRPTRTLRVEE